ncbi:MAG: hypothetical protein AABX70_00770 [Nanoarchaeota archaeon]
MTKDNPQELGKRMLTVEIQTGPAQYEIYQGPGKVFYYPPNGVGARYFIQTVCGGELMLLAEEVEVDEIQLVQLNLESRINSEDLRQVTDLEIDAVLSGLPVVYIQ